MMSFTDDDQSEVATHNRTYRQTDHPYTYLTRYRYPERSSVELDVSWYYKYSDDFDVSYWVSDSRWAHNRCCVDSDCRGDHDHLLPRGKVWVRQGSLLPGQTKIIVGGIYICWEQIWPRFYVDYASDYLLTRTFGGFTIFQKAIG